MKCVTLILYNDLWGTNGYAVIHNRNLKIWAYDSLGAPILAGCTDLRLGLSPTCKCIDYNKVLVSPVYIMLLLNLPA